MPPLCLRRASLVAVLSLTPLGAASPPLTTVQDTLYKADGSRFNGVAFVEWKSFEASDRSVILNHSLAVPIANGVLRVQLVPTTNATPGAGYKVRYNSDGRVQFEETWAVPPSNTPLRLRDVRVGSAAPAPAQATLLQEVDVNGLPADLAVRPVKGPGYYPSRVAVVSASGTLESAVGILTDCVRVDGSSVPCGGTVNFGFADNEAPAGTIDGTNAAFTLAAAPEPVSSVALYRNGVLQQRGVDFDVSGQTITFRSGSVPQSGDGLLASYRLSAPANPANFDFVDNEALSGAVDGSNAVFTLSATPEPAASLSIYRNGVLQKRGADYNTSGRTVLFDAAAVPQTGDTLLVSYRIPRQ